MNRNRWADPILLNVGIASNDAISPSTDVQANSVIDTQINRIKLDGSDRYMTFRQPLTGTAKLVAESFTQ